MSLPISAASLVPGHFTQQAPVLCGASGSPGGIHGSLKLGHHAAGQGLGPGAPASMPAGCPLTPGITESRAAGPPGDPRGVRRRGSPKPGRGLSLCAAGTHPQAHPALTRVLQLPVHAGGRVAAVRVLVVAVHDRLRRAAAVCGVGRKSSSWVDAGRLRGPGRGREASGSAPSSGQRVALRVTPWPPLHPVCPASHPHPPVLLSPGGCPAGA